MSDHINGRVIHEVFRIIATCYAHVFCGRHSIIQGV